MNDETFALDAGTAGTSGSAYTTNTLAYDPAGNLTFDGRFQYAYDAWNRLVSVHRAYRSTPTAAISTGSLVARYTYDGLGRRTSRAVRNSGIGSGGDATFHDYYSKEWQLLETRNGSGHVLQQFAWAPGNGGGYVDELVQVANNLDPGDLADGNTNTWSGDDSYYGYDHCELKYTPMADAHYNLLGVSINPVAQPGTIPTGNASGALSARYEYTPYGQRQAYGRGEAVGDYDRNGICEVIELNGIFTRFNQTNACYAQGDIDGNGTISNIDISLWGIGFNAPLVPSLVRTAGNHPAPIGQPDSFSIGGAISTTPLLPFGHQGLYHDAESANSRLHNRARDLGTVLGRYNQRDPLGYVDGMSAYEYVRSRLEVVYEFGIGFTAMPLFLNDIENGKTNGVTICNRDTGKVQTEVTEVGRGRYGCAWHCISKHESTHKKQIESCCSKYSRLYNRYKNSDQQYRRMLDSRFRRWIDSNRTSFECEAYKRGARCAERELKARNCCDKPEDQCCKDLNAYKNHSDDGIKDNCKDGQHLPRTPCPF